MIVGDVAREPWQFSAVELSAAYREGLTPDEALDSVLARIDHANPSLNAIITLDEAGARRAAQASTRRWANASPLSPLDGVPVTIKDNVLVAGLRATWGSKLFADYVPDTDEIPVARLRAAGAIILGKTNVPEFTVHGYTHNALFGTTRNPWDAALTPGGSSGGAVAAVATGMGAFALGTDGGGSIRRPAAHTGLVGFKPSRGIVPRGIGFPAILHDFEVVGPIARCVDDVVAAMDFIGANEWRQPMQQPQARRIAFAQTFDHAPVDSLIRTAVDAAVVTIEASRYEIDRIGSFDLAAPLDRVWPIISQTGVAWLLSAYPDRRHLVSSPLAAMAAAGEAYTARDYLGALDTIRVIDDTVNDFFDRYDFLLTPTTAAMPWPADETHPTSIDGIEVGPRGHAVFTSIANALGLPAISLPCQVERGSLPIGLQVITRKGSDRALLTLSRELETVLSTGIHYFPAQ